MILESIKQYMQQWLSPLQAMVQSAPWYEQVKGLFQWFGTNMNSLYVQFHSLFDKKPEEVIQLSREHQLCAIIAWLAYEPVAQRPEQIDSFTKENKRNQQLVSVYVDQQSKICIVGYRWTDFKDIKDILSDAQIVLGVNALDPRVTASLTFFDDLMMEYEDYQIRVTGHSLGWTLAYLVAKHRQPNQCVVFNPGSAPNSLFIQMLQETVRKVPRTTVTTTYKILWDIVSTCGFIGNTRVFYLPSALQPMALHAMDNFVPVEFLTYYKERLKSKVESPKL